MVLVDRVRYRDLAPWPGGADGVGLSLQRPDCSAYGDDPAHWVAATPTPGGPTGSGTAPTFVVQPVSRSVLTAGTVVLEKTRHPRPKLCVAGVTILADPVMHWLDLSWERLAGPHVLIHEICLRFEDREAKLRLPNMFRIVRHSQFDARLVAIARDRAIEVREETPITGLRRSPEGGNSSPAPTGMYEPSTACSGSGLQDGQTTTNQHVPDRIVLIRPHGRVTIHWVV